MNFFIKPKGVYVFKFVMRYLYRQLSKTQFSLQLILKAPIMRGSRNFRQGGPGSIDRETLSRFFFHSSTYLQFYIWGPMVYFKENYHFKVPEGVQHFPGGAPTFFRGIPLLISIETYRTCDFPGGPYPISSLWISACQSQQVV